MANHYLLVSRSHDSRWVKVLQASLAPEDLLTPVTENQATMSGMQQLYDVILLDATTIKDLVPLVSRLRAQQPTACLLVVTASPTWWDAREAFRAGATDYIHKTMHPQQLRATWDFVLARPRRTTATAATPWGPAVPYDQAPTRSEETGDMKAYIDQRLAIKEENNEREAGIMMRPPSAFSKETAVIKGILLMIDNDLHFLQSRMEFLEREGYRVLMATSSSQARHILERESIDLLIVDLRLEDDDDDKDVSGLLLAQEVAPLVPKILLTAFPTLAVTREALRPKVGGIAVAVDCIDKTEQPEALLHAVRIALRQKVFLVHGHDEAAKEAVARFLEKLNLQVTVLREQPNGGRAIIEKLEAYANVAFAVVLLTPDDVGGKRDQPQENRYRARQNVIFELGFFVGKLGRRNVAVLSKGEVEIPSDYHGILRLPMDTGEGWPLPLASEMRNAGLSIDLNRAL